MKAGKLYDFIGKYTHSETEIKILTEEGQTFTIAKAEVEEIDGEVVVWLKAESE